MTLARTPAILPPNLPHPKLEAWKFTNLARIAGALRCTPLCTTIGCLEAALPVVAGPQAVFHNGTLAPQLSESIVLAHGVTLATEPQTPNPEPRTPNSDTLDTLPAPFHHTLTVKGKVRLPLHLIHVMSGQPSVARFAITLEDDAELTLVEHHVAAPKFASWQHVHVAITLGRGARLTHSTLQTLPPECMLTRRQHLALAENAAVSATQLQSGAAFSRLETHTRLSRNASFAHVGLALTRHRQHHDVTMTTTHEDTGNETHIRQRNLVDDEGHAVFQGKFYVAQPAQKTNAYMHCHNMLLSDAARTSHKPELEIYADDVKCSHGAATGGLDAAQLFYLQARGLAAPAARALLLQGFAEEFIAQFPDFMRPALAARLTEWLAEQPFNPPEQDEFVPIEGEWLAERAETPHLRLVAENEEVHDE